MGQWRKQKEIVITQFIERNETRLVFVSFYKLGNNTFFFVLFVDPTFTSSNNGLQFFTVCELAVNGQSSFSFEFFLVNETTDEMCNFLGQYDMILKVVLFF